MLSLDELPVIARDVFADAPVRFAYLFGSRATGAAHVGSDIDIAVMFGESVTDEQRLWLTLRLGRQLEQRLRANVDLVPLNDAPLRLVSRVLANRKILHSADEPGRVRYESTMRSLAFDFELHARELDRELLLAHARRHR